MFDLIKHCSYSMKNGLDGGKTAGEEDSSRATACEMLLALARVVAVGWK